MSRERVILIVVCVVIVLLIVAAFVLVFTGSPGPLGAPCPGGRCGFNSNNVIGHVGQPNFESLSLTISKTISSTL
jgi:hypothetical protein